MSYEKYYIYRKALIGYESFKTIEQSELLNFLNENISETLTIEQNRIYIESSEKPQLVDSQIWEML